MITDFNNPNRSVIIGLDHGYGNMKTAHACFPTGVTRHEKEPTFKSNLLFFEGIYYTIGEEHKEFTADKMKDPDFFILTLAGIASELAFYGRQAADVHLAVGLPPTWVAEQKDDFKKYLMQYDPRNEILYFFKQKEYRIRITDVDVFPQGFAAIVSHLSDFKGVNMLCDIGNGTMNVMTITNGLPISSKCFTEKYGTHQCTLLIRERLMQKYHVTIEDAVIEEVLRTGTADIGNSKRVLKDNFGVTSLSVSAWQEEQKNLRRQNEELSTEYRPIREKVDKMLNVQHCVETARNANRSRQSNRQKNHQLLE